MGETKMSDIITGAIFAIRITWELVKAIGRLKQEFQNLPEEEREEYLRQWREATKADAESRQPLWGDLITWINTE